MARPDKRTTAIGVDRQRWAQWFKTCVADYLGSELPADQRGTLTDRRMEVAKAYDEARAEFGLSKCGANSENVRSWEKGAVPDDQHLEPFLRAFGLLDSFSSGGDARPGEAYLEFFHATGRQYQERSHYIQKIHRINRSNLNHVVDLNRFDKIGIYRGHYQGHTLQSFYAGAISEAHKLSIQAISETGREDPTPEAETQALRSLFARGINALLISHWSSSQALPEDLQNQVQNVPVLLFDSNTTAFEIARPMIAKVDQNAIIEALANLVREYTTPNGVNQSSLSTILILNDRRHFSPLKNRAMFWDVHEHSLVHLAHFVHVECDVSNPLDFERVNRKIIERALREHKPAVVVAMWYEFARVLISLVEDDASLGVPHLLSVDLTDHGFSQLRRNTPLQATVYFDAFDAGRESIGHLAARLRGTPLQGGNGFDSPVRVVRSKDASKLGASSVNEYLERHCRQR